MNIKTKLNVGDSVRFKGEEVFFDVVCIRIEMSENNKYTELYSVANNDVYIHEVKSDELQFTETDKSFMKLVLDFMEGLYVDWEESVSGELVGLFMKDVNALINNTMWEVPLQDHMREHGHLIIINYGDGDYVGIEKCTSKDF